MTPLELKNQPAFPQRDERGDGSYIQYAGISIRDYFAAKAMQSMSTGEWPNMGTYQEIAKRAYVLADAMLKARQS
jgi:hypothetical protein